MESLSNDEMLLVNEFKITNKNEIALYFYNKFKDDLVEIIYSKINNKFYNVPIERGDLIYIIWKGLIKTLKEADVDPSLFNSFLINNCYLLGLQEARKFIKNGEMVLNNANSLEKMILDGNFKKSEPFMLDWKLSFKNLIDDVCEYVEKFTKDEVKKVVYLKSIGYTIKDIAKTLQMKKCKVIRMLDLIKKIVDKIY